MRKTIDRCGRDARRGRDPRLRRASRQGPTPATPPPAGSAPPPAAAPRRPRRQAWRPRPRLQGAAGRGRSRARRELELTSGGCCDTEEGSGRGGPRRGRDGRPLLQGRGLLHEQPEGTVKAAVMNFNGKKATSLHAESSGGGTKVADASRRSSSARRDARCRRSRATGPDGRRRLRRARRALLAGRLRAACPPLRSPEAGRARDGRRAHRDRRREGGRRPRARSRPGAVGIPLRPAQERDRGQGAAPTPMPIPSPSCPSGGRGGCPAIRTLLGEVDYTLVASDGKDAALTVDRDVHPRREGGPRPAPGHAQRDLRLRRRGQARAPPVPRQEREGRRRTLSLVHHENDEILVALGAPAPAKQPVKVRFEIDGDFLIRPGGDNYWELGTAPWFPQPSARRQPTRSTPS